MSRVVSGFLFALASGVAAATPDPEALDNPKFYALLALGAHYQYGGHSPETGFDCSGLIAHVFKRAWGLVLPRRTEEQAMLGKPVRRQELEPGDLVFYNTRNRAYSHVGIYVGDGRFIHAPRRGSACAPKASTALIGRRVSMERAGSSRRPSARFPRSSVRRFLQRRPGTAIRHKGS